MEEMLELNTNDRFISELLSFNISGEIAAVNPPAYPPDKELKLFDMSFFRIDQLLHDSEYPRREAFENVLRSLDNEAFNLVYILTGKTNGVELCVGVVKNEHSLNSSLSTADYGKMVQNIFEGNFNGSKLTRLRGNNLTETVIEQSKKYNSAGMILGIPSMNESSRTDGGDFQGIDRLINSMLGLEWRLAVVCEPVPKAKIRNIQDEIYRLYNKLAAVSKLSMQASKNSGTTFSEGSNSSETKGESIGHSSSDTHGGSYSRSFSVTNSSTSTRSLSNSTNDDGFFSFDPHQTTSSNSNSRSSSESNVSGLTKSGSDSHSDGTNESISASHTQGESSSVALNSGTSSSFSFELTNKKAAEIMKYIDEELLKRLSVGMSKGLYSTSVYYMSDTPANANRLKSCLMSLFQGDGSTFSPLTSHELHTDVIKEYNILNTYQNHAESDSDTDTVAALLHSRPVENDNVYLSTLLTAGEVSLFAGLPQTEVPGIQLDTGVNFGLNENITEDSGNICLGNMIQKGRVLNDIPLFISQKLLSKHTFVAGVTGSGKTTTCHKILDEVNKAGIQFMIIEPAKTEYRILINKYHDLVVFTFGNESVAPFRLNPFELIEDEIISSHIDMLKATFTSAFPMEASMPQILEEAMYKCYEDKGWNIITNQNDKYGENAWKNPDSMPILSELLENLKTVTEGKGFGDRLQSEYIGSLVSRLSNLTVGSKGCMLNCRKSVDFHYIVNNNVVFEMEDLKSPEDKSLIMGLILSRVSAVIRKEHMENSGFKHLTLVEEAHRLLKKPDYSDSGARTAAVETFSDLLAEVRKYGEGLVIVDQIPNKLAPEVLKNTNTKIIHKLLARDDKEVVGDTMLMNDKQKEYLSSLKVGEAVVFTENTSKPVHVRIDAVTNTNEEEVQNSVVKNRFDIKRKTDFGCCYNDLAVREYLPEFMKILQNLRCMNDHEDERRSVLAHVDEICSCSDMPKEIIWRELIEKAMVKAQISDPDDTRKNVLTIFFANTYSDDGFSVDMLEADDIKYFGGF